MRFLAQRAAAVILALFAQCALSSSTAWTSKELELIDRYIEENKMEPSALADGNLKPLRQWLQQEKGKGFNMAKADAILNSLVELYKVSDSDAACTEGALQTLTRAKAAMDFDANWWHPSDESDWIRSVQQLARDIAARCKPQLEESLPSLLGSLDVQKMQLLNTRMQELESEMLRKVVGRPAGQSELTRSNYLAAFMVFENPSEKYRVAGAIANMINRRDGKPVSTSDADFHCTSERNYKKFVDEFFLAPCKYFVDSTRHILERYAEYTRTAMDPGEQIDRFSTEVRRYSFCRNFADNRASMYEPVKSLLRLKESAEREAKNSQ